MRTSTQRLLAAGLLGVLVVVAQIALAQSSNPHVGMWKANVAKSKVSSGPALKSATTKIEPAGAGVKYTVDNVLSDGSVGHWEFTANYDGKDTRITGNSPFGDVVALTRVNPTTVRIDNKKDGKVISTQTSVVSNDGKTRTLTTKGTDALGKTIDFITTYERQ